MYGVNNDVNARVKLKVGDKVRISKTIRTFDKGNLNLNPNGGEKIHSLYIIKLITIKIAL